MVKRVLRIASADLSNEWSQQEIFSTVKRALQIASADVSNQ